MFKRPAHQLLLQWLILSGVIWAVCFIAWEQALIQPLFTLDKSRISWVIALSYSLVSLHCMHRVWIISTEHHCAQSIVELLHGTKGGTLRVTAQGLYLHDMALPQNPFTEHMQVLYSSRVSRKAAGEPLAAGTSTLADVYATMLKGPQEIGWFLSDAMLKLGLLGTIIGFIFMLVPVSGISDFDSNAIRNVLQEMSGGMSTALHTTLIGLICSILASLQYHMLDKHCDEILGIFRYLAESSRKQ